MQRRTVAMADKTGGKKEQKKKPRSKTEKPKYKTVNKDSEEGGQEGGGQNQNSGGQNQNIQKNNNRKFQQNQNQRVQGGQQGGNQFEPYLGPAEVQRGVQNGESWGLQLRGKFVSGGLTGDEVKQR